MAYPFPAEKSLLTWSALKRAVRGEALDFRLMFTSPPVRLPYSTEGIPRMISTLSMLSVGRVRMSTPFETDSLSAWLVPCRYCRLASVFIAMPSTTNPTPNEAIASLVLPASRILIRLALPILGSTDFPPGSSSSRSVKLVGCRCSMALRSIFDALVSPFDSEAVMTTSFSAITDEVRLKDRVVFREREKVFSDLS